MADVRDLLRVPDARIDEALAEVMGLRYVLRLPIPAYCSPDSPRWLLEKVEAKIVNGCYLVDQYAGTLSAYDHSVQGWGIQHLIFASAPLRARAALWVLDRQRAVKLIAEVQQNA